MHPSATRRAAVTLAVAVLSTWVLFLPSSRAATEVPTTVQITDPAGDANYLNDQGLDAFIGPQGDQPGGASFAPGDILAVWFSATPEAVQLHVQTAEPGPSDQLGLLYRIVANPAPPAKGCLWFEATVPSLTYQGSASAMVENTCTKSGRQPGEVTIETLPDGSGVTTLSFPRSSLLDFGAGEVIAAPVAFSRNLSGVAGVAEPTAPQIDNTVAGTDFVIPAAEPVPTTSPSTKRCKKVHGRKRCKPRPR